MSALWAARDPATGSTAGSAEDGLIPAWSPAAALAELARLDPARRYLRFADRDVTTGELQHDVEQLCAVLSAAGIGPGARVAVALENSVEHVALVFALSGLGAQWVPVNTRLRGEPLRHVLQDAGPGHVIARWASDIGSQIEAAAGLTGAPRSAQVPDGPADLAVRLVAGGPAGPDAGPDIAAIMYTSGTTGPAKGVLVTQAMLWAAALGCREVTDAQRGDVLYLWEPLYHIGGAQVMLLPLVADVSVALAPRFSARRFWPEVIAAGATHIHYLGGILQILLRRPATTAEHAHQVRIGWGAGADPQLWAASQERFGIMLHECYGMTETSSIVTVNKRGPGFGAGFPLPWFEVRLAEPQAAAGTGEILVRPRVAGLTSPGYLRTGPVPDEDRHGWLATGDLGSLGPAGDLRFRGRQTDSVRHRGENVSAWEIETVFQHHPAVVHCAVFGVPAEIGEEDIAMLVVLAPEVEVTPHALAGWARGQLADFQLPRYIGIVPGLPLTPSQRVVKKDIRQHAASLVDVAPERG